jgi:hypothetical protein
MAVTDNEINTEDSTSALYIDPGDSDHIIHYLGDLCANQTFAKPVEISALRLRLRGLESGTISQKTGTRSGTTRRILRTRHTCMTCVARGEESVVGMAE